MAIIGILVGVLSAALVARRGLRTAGFLHGRRQPAFYFEHVDDHQLGLPVFTYHSVASPATSDSITPEAFESHLRHLADNGYSTLTADEVYEHLANRAPISPRSVALTFDDGRASLWTVAFPLLERYGMKAISFLVPLALPETGRRAQRPAGGPRSAEADEAAVNADLSEQPNLTWEEVRAMHDSGLVDFQSHTLDHAVVATSPEIVDFAHPESDFGHANYRAPLLRRCGRDQPMARPAHGTPIYRHAPRMAAGRRFYDDAGLRNACVEYVQRNGGDHFFARAGWRAELGRVVARYREEHASVHEAWETSEERDAALRRSLAESKQVIEERLPGHRARHLCFPWHRYSIRAAAIAREVGYVSAFIDINPQKPSPDWSNPYSLQRLLPINEPGDDPFQITRIDVSGDLPQSLPGDGRLTYGKRFLKRFCRRPTILRRGI